MLGSYCSTARSLLQVSYLFRLCESLALLKFEGATVETCKIVSLVSTNDQYRSENKEDKFEQTVACACKVGRIAGTHREAPACVPEHIVTNQKWCEMQPCLKHETCRQLEGDVGWLCTSSQKTKTTFVGNSSLADVRLTTKSSEMATYEHSTNVQDIFKN